MSEQALFSGTAAGTVVRLFLFDGLSTFGVVHRRHPHHFVVRPVGFPYVAEERFRYDGLMDGGKDAPPQNRFLSYPGRRAKPFDSGVQKYPQGPIRGEPKAMEPLDEHQGRAADGKRRELKK